MLDFLSSFGYNEVSKTPMVLHGLCGRHNVNPTHLAGYSILRLRVALHPTRLTSRERGGRRTTIKPVIEGELHYSAEGGSPSKFLERKQGAVMQKKDMLPILYRSAALFEENLAGDDLR